MKLNIEHLKSDLSLLSAIQTTNCDLIAFEFLSDDFDIIAPQSHESVVAIRERINTDDFVELFNDSSTIFIDLNTVLKEVDAKELIQYISNLQADNICGSVWYREEDDNKLYHHNIKSYCDLTVQQLLNLTFYIQRIQD